MRELLREHLAEALTGLAVVLVAAWFVAFAWNRTGRGAGTGGYSVTANFPNVTGVSVGTDVRVAGMKVGAVTAQALDPQSWQAKLTLELDPAVKLPTDTSAAITSEGLLGSSFIALAPGGETTMLRAGDQITETQGATDLMGLVGSFINRGGGGSGDAAAPASAGEAAAAAK